MGIKIIVFILILIICLTGCGEFIGFNDFPAPDLGEITEVRVYLTEESLEKLYDSAHGSDWAPCIYRENDRNTDADIRVRGFTSRLYPKKSFTVRINNNGREIKWAFNASHYSWIKNRIVMYAYIQAGLPALSSIGVAFFINDSYIGYYSKFDLYYEEELENNYYGIDGELFSCYFHDIGNDFPIEEYSEKKFPGDDDFSSLNTLVFNARNMDEQEWKDWVSEYVDKDEIIKYMVIHDFFAVADTTNTNFYIYNYGKVLILPWDNELALYSDNYNLAGHNLLTTRLMEIPEYLDSYKTEFHRLFLDDNLFLDILNQENDRIFNEIDKAVKADPTPYLLYEDFLDEVDTMREYLSTGPDGRREELLSELIFNE